MTVVNETSRRRAGILLPVFSLPGSRGIGTLGAAARQFIDLLADHDQQIWQILPLCPPGYGGSPYSSYSTHAGNTLFIDLDQLLKAGWLTPEELESLDWGADPRKVDYAALEASSQAALRKAFARCPNFQTDPDYLSFAKRSFWLEDYAMFRAIKQSQGGKSWIDWPEPLRNRNPEALHQIGNELAAEIAFYRFGQWIFDRQWDDLHAYAQKRGVKILGDIPIYVSLDSVDTWVNPALFQLGKDKRPLFIAGVPPDGFSAAGQVWGNPLYNWPKHRDTSFEWWTRRVEVQLKRVDMLRIDHFRGLESYFAIPPEADSAAEGHWEQGPGIEFFRVLSERLGGLPFVLEDLGYLTDEVRRLREDTGLPGLQLIQFAFDSREPANYWPFEMPRNSVVYTGTHDNDTLRGWFASLSEKDQELARTYTASQSVPEADLPEVFVTLALTSVADTCIIPMADYLGLDSSGRINTPAKADGNWSWRMTAADLTAAPWEAIGELTRISGRGAVTP